MNNAEAVIGRIVEEVMTRLGEAPCGSDGGLGIFGSMNEAVEACAAAQKKLVKMTYVERAAVIDAIRCVAVEHAEELAKMAENETKMGNWRDKTIKNKLAAQKTPGIEDLRSEAMSGDDGLTLVELSPFGVIGAITPTTNPTETIICNAIGMIAAGNGVVFSPHPTAKDVSLYMIRLINAAIARAGGPANIVATVADPSIEQANVMMQHPKINMLVATGGPGVVKAVLSSGKKAIGAGAGNPPALVDETADIERAARDVILGCSFDHNLPCVAEKEVIVVEQVADYLVFCMKGSGAYFIEDAETLRRLEALVMTGDAPNKDYIGRSAERILSDLGVACPAGTKVISMEVSVGHAFVQHELMMPILPVVRVKDFAEGLATAVAVEHGFRHTAIMHSRDVERLTAFARAIQTTIFVKNGPSYAGIGVGGEGHTTFTIAGPTGEGLTSARSFTRKRRCVLVEGFNIR